MRQDNMQGKTVFLITCLDESKNHSNARNAWKKYLHMQYAWNAKTFIYDVIHTVSGHASFQMLFVSLYSLIHRPCKLASFTAKFAFYINDIIQKWKMIIFSRQQWYDSCGPCVLPQWTSIQHTTRIHLISFSSEGVWAQLSALVWDFGLSHGQDC